MNYLKIPLNDIQKEDIGKEIDRLFMLQDKMLSEKKQEFFVNELDREGFPFGAIIQGIRALSDADLKSIKFYTIKESIRKFIQYDETVIDCRSCRGHGRISMVRDDNYSFAFACKCAAGRKYKDHVKWNGEVIQEYQGHNYTLQDYVILGDQYESWKRGTLEKEEINDPETEAILKTVGGEIVSREPQEIAWDD